MWLFSRDENNYIPKDRNNYIPRKKDILYSVGTIREKKDYSFFKSKAFIIWVSSAILLTIGIGSASYIASKNTSKQTSEILNKPHDKQDSIVIVDIPDVTAPGVDIITQSMDDLKSEFIDLLEQHNIYDYSKYYEISGKKVSDEFPRLSKNIVPKLHDLTLEELESLLFAKDFEWYIESKHKEKPQLIDKILTFDDRDRILGIMHSEEFKTAIASAYTNISFHRLFSLAQAISRSAPDIYSFNDISHPERKMLVEWYITQLKKLEKTTIVSKDINVCMINSSDFVQWRDMFSKRYKSLSKDSSKILSNQNIPLHATEVQARAQVKIFQHSIEKSVWPTCIIIQSHGGNSRENGVPSSTVCLWQYGATWAYIEIKPKELGAWMVNSANRNNLSNFRIFLPACLWYRYIKALHDYLETQKCNWSPTIIGLANDGKFGYWSRWVDDLLIPFSDFKNKKALKGIDFLDMENKQTDNDPAFFISSPPVLPKASYYHKKYLEVSDLPETNTWNPCT